MATEHLTWEEEEQVRGRMARLRWLINLRWAGLVGIALTGAATQVAGYTVLLNPGWLAAPLALIYNAVFFFWLRAVQKRYARGIWNPERLKRVLNWQAYLQALCDVTVLYLVIYLNSGIECPIPYIPLVAVMFSSIVLPPGGIFLQANVGALLFTLMAVGEYLGWWPHITFVRPEFQSGLYRHPTAVLSAVLAMGVMMNLAAFVMANLGGRLNLAEERIRGLLGSLRREVQEAAGRLGQAAHSLGAGGEEVGRAADQIAQTVQQIARGAGEQAGQLERLRGNLAHLAEAARRVAEGAQESQAASAQSVSEAQRGREAATEATARMEEMARVFQRVEHSLGALAQRSQEIAEIALAIDRFAERTDLLALNAGIEAARAGEHGRGFAVVAGEVKKLAASSSASAARVAEMVRQVQAGIAEVGEAVQAGVGRVQEGQASVEVLRQVLAAMGEVIARTDGLVGTMEHLARQQLEAHREIAAVAGEIASGAEETAAGAEEAAAAVEEQTASFAEFGRAVQELAGLAAQLERAVAGLSEVD